MLPSGCSPKVTAALHLAESSCWSRLLIQRGQPKQSEAWLYLCHYHSVDRAPDSGWWLRGASTSFIKHAADTTCSPAKTDTEERGDELNRPEG